MDKQVNKLDDKNTLLPMKFIIFTRYPQLFQEPTTIVFPQPHNLIFSLPNSPSIRYIISSWLIRATYNNNKNAARYISLLHHQQRKKKSTTYPPQEAIREILLFQASRAYT